jgi:hypothetical protein
MRLVKADLWSSRDDYILVTANSYINRYGELVMGRGAALELATKHPELPLEFGDLIRLGVGHLGEYNLLFEDTHTYGIFQVKYHFRDNADIKLIERSTVKLTTVAQILNNQTFSVNLPGVGWGHLEVKDVIPLIDRLPNNVTVYYQ